VDAAQRAVDAWHTLRATCIRFGDGTATTLEGPDAGPAPLWPLSQVLVAAIDMARLTGDYEDTLALIRGLEAFRAGEGYAPRPGTRRRFYDDNAWIGLALIQLHRQTDDAVHLAHARRVFKFVATGQVKSGGVRWRERSASLHTCSTAPAAQLALHIHRLTGDPDALALARRAVDWLDRAMRLPSGLMADHVRRGDVDRSVRSYNQGSSAGAFALLSQAGSSDARLNDGMRIARASLAFFTHDVLWREPPVFNTIWFRDLIALDAMERVPGLFGALDAYLDRVVTQAPDPGTGLFSAGGIGTYDGTPAIDDAGLVQLLALRAWPSERLTDVT
jgi:hypothetical protein